MSEIKTCSQCGEVLPTDAIAGTCSACQQRGGLSPSESPSGDDHVNDVILLYLQAVERGEAVNREKFLAEHSDIAEELKSFFGNQAQFQQVAEAVTLPPVASTEQQPFDPDKTTLVAATPAIPTAGEVVRYFGDYELLLEIARGGMGVVYKARQVSLKREVALKMILAGQLASPQDVQRFYTEAEAAAQLDHPGIVPVFEVGQHQGQHFFSMGLVEGRSLAARVAEGPLPAREAAGLVREVAEAVQYAHDKGVIHRDLKPGNILLDKDGRPRVTDFGLAKLTQSGSDLTGTGQILGTPSYMPPEQASGKTDEIGPAADVYALGAILYCLLTGRPPFQAANSMDTLLQVLDQEPVPLRQLNQQVPLDLETISLKCLEKDRSRRYGSANDLALDLKRFLKGEPIVARPVSSAERVWRWCRRNPVIATLISATAITLLAATIISRHYGLIAAERAEFATKQSEKLRGALAANYFERGLREYESGRPITSVEDLTRAMVMTPAESPLYAAYESILIDRCLQGGRQIAPPLVHSEPVVRVAFSSDGTHVFTASNSFGRIWNATSGSPIGEPMSYYQVLMRLKVEKSELFDEFAKSLWNPNIEIASRIREKLDKNANLAGMMVSPDRNRAVLVESTPTRVGFGGRRLQLWDVPAQIRLGEPIGDDSNYSTEGLAFSPDSSLLLMRISEFVTTNSTQSRYLIQNTATGIVSPLIQPGGRSNRSGSARFNPDSSQVVMTNGEKAVRVWDVRTGTQVGAELQHELGVDWADYSPDGTAIVTKDAGNTVRLWNARSHAPLGEPMVHEKGVDKVEFSSDGACLVTTSDDNAIRLWNGESGVSLGTALRHEQKVTSLAFSPDCTRLVTGSADRTARVWSVPNIRCVKSIRNGPSFLNRIASPDGTRVFLRDHNYMCQLLDAEVGIPIGARWKEAGLNRVEFSPDSTRLVEQHADGTAQIRDARSGEKVGEPLPIPNPFVDPQARMFGSEGPMLILGSRLCDTRTGRLVGIDLQAEKQLQIFRSRPVEKDSLVDEVGIDHSNYAFTTNGLRLCTASADGNVRLWDGQSGTQVGDVIPALSAVAFSADGNRMLGINDKSDQVRVWDTDTGKLCCHLSRGGTSIRKAAFSSDGTRLVLFEFSYSLCLFDSRTGSAVCNGLKHTSIVDGFVVSPRGARIVTIVDNEQHQRGDTIWLWDSGTGRNISSSMKHSAPVVRVAFSPDGTRVITTCKDNSVRLWDALTGASVGHGFKHDGEISKIVFSPDGTRVVTSSSDKSSVVLDTASGNVLGQTMNHTNPVVAAAFSTDGNRIATGTDQGSIRIWNAHTGAFIGDEIKRHGMVHNIRFGSNGKLIFFQTTGDTVTWHNVAMPEVKGLTVAHRRSILRSWACCDSDADGTSHRVQEGDIAQIREAAGRNDFVQRFAAVRHANSTLDECAEIVKSADHDWADLYKKSETQSEDFTDRLGKLTQERTVYSHRSAARRALDSESWFAARFHASRVLMLQPGDHELIDVLIKSVLEGKTPPENVEELISRIKVLDPTNAAQLSDTQLKSWMQRRAATAEFQQLLPRAESFFKSGELEKATEAFPRAYELSLQLKSSDSVAIAQNLCYALLSAGKVADYRSTCAQVRERFENSTNANEVLVLCRILILIPDAIEDLPSLVSLAKKAVSLDQRSWSAHHVLAGAYLRNGEYQEALKTLDQIQSLNLVPNPPNVDFWLSQILNDSLRAIALLKLQRIEAARDVLQSVEKLSEEHLQATPEQPFGEITRYWWNWCPIQEFRRQAHELLRETERQLASLNTIENDRAVAGWVILVGGRVKLSNGAGEFVSKLADLPSECQITSIDLNACRSIDNHSIQWLSDLRSLTALTLSRTPITSLGLRNLKNLPKLVELNLIDTSLTDDGLQFIATLPRLTRLQLDGTQISDEGLPALQNQPELVMLGLANSRVTDAGLKHLSGLRKLRELWLSSNDLSGEGLASLKGMSELADLHLGHTRIGDAACRHLAILSGLTSLDLRSTYISDDGLAQFKDLRQLKGLELRETRITGTGFQSLLGSIDLEWVILYGAPVDDEGLSSIGELGSLLHLGLDRTMITDTGLTHLQNLSRLRVLGLMGTNITDGGLKTLQKLSTLESLWVRETHVTGVGVDEFRTNVPKCQVVATEGEKQ